MNKQEPNQENKTYRQVQIHFSKKFQQNKRGKTHYRHNRGKIHNTGKYGGERDGSTLEGPEAGMLIAQQDFWRESAG